MFLKINGLDIIKISAGRIHLHLIPLYLRPNEWNEDFEILVGVLLNQNLENVIVMGDLNVRIGNLQIKIAESNLSSISKIFEQRQSKDIFVNARGKN